jgi:hypothetical protein
MRVYAWYASAAVVSLLPSRTKGSLELELKFLGPHWHGGNTGMVGTWLKPVCTGSCATWSGPCPAALRGHWTSEGNGCIGRLDFKFIRASEVLGESRSITEEGA